MSTHPSTILKVRSYLPTVAMPARREKTGGSIGMASLTRDTTQISVWNVFQNKKNCILLWLAKSPVKTSVKGEPGVSPLKVEPGSSSSKVVDGGDNSWTASSKSNGKRYWIFCKSFLTMTNQSCSSFFHLRLSEEFHPLHVKKLLATLLRLRRPKSWQCWSLSCFFIVTTNLSSVPLSL